ncbi:hypothetical protein BC833DRAFT_625252, partial [Globomyces pollinis-pini]
AAISFGVTIEDATAVGASLESLFNVKCSIPAKLTPKSDSAPQGMCGSKDCQKADKGVCPDDVPVTTITSTTTSSPTATSTMKSNAESITYKHVLTIVALSFLLL